MAVLTGESQDQPAYLAVGVLIGATVALLVRKAEPLLART
jgi:LPXTG-motif cell wall-anchored protein